MDRKAGVSISKFLSYVLRHRPESIGIELDAAGWVGVEELLGKCAAHGRALRRDELEEIVATSPKRRFALSDDGHCIRANQGHSVSVELGYEPAEPPAVLFHGTVAAALPSIRRQGLRSMSRHHVHLSADLDTACEVGRRRGHPVVLRIAAREMARAGHVFHRSANGVWLTEQVPPEYLEEN
jgi:putative RNA 2'-phosphotransferase